MKKTIFILFFTLGFSMSISAQHSKNGNWQNSYDKAVQISKANDKLTLIFFTGSDWCGPCKMLVQDFFNSKKFKKYAEDKFVLYEADFPRRTDLVPQDRRDKNYYLRTLYDVNSYPTVLVLDKDGIERGRKSGYTLLRDTSFHYDFLKEIMADM